MEIEITQPRLVDVRYIKVDAGVRYWQDTTVNGEEDIDFYESKGVGTPKIPFAVKVKDEPTSNIYSDHYRWQPVIDITGGYIVGWKKGVKAQVHYKVCDDGTYSLLDMEYKEIVGADSYVPDVLCPHGGGYGDYIIMDIDEDGFIKDWHCEADDLTNIIENGF